MSGGTAYYNEIDPFAAAWLRELIAAGHIAPGIVDERDIRDVRPDELARFTQCHFFAGIGVWSYALRRAGWSDDRPVWTGSCPCQPFSAAGKGGGFTDERHLWPAWQWLIEQCEPVYIIGEQVASSNVDPWLDLVQADVEGMGYAFGCVPVPAAGFGSPNIRGRAFWVADTMRDGAGDNAGTGVGSETAANGIDWRVPRERLRARVQGASVRLDDADDAGLEGFGRGHQAPFGRIATVRPASAAVELGRMADPRFGELETRCRGHNSEAPAVNEDGVDAYGCGSIHSVTAAPTNGFWRDADWLFCRDQKFRPVEPGTFPLAHGASARVGRLRGYGNAINAEVATGFIEAVIGHLDGTPAPAIAA